MDKFSFKSRSIEENLHRIPIERDNQILGILIREFALQVHHEQFVISAKEYFQINLKLIGSVSSRIIQSKQKLDKVSSKLI